MYIFTAPECHFDMKLAVGGGDGRLPRASAILVL